MVYNLHAEYKKKERRILVSWAYAPIKQEKLYFLVFRSAAGNPLAPYRSVPSSQTNLFDDGLLGNGRYTYAVKVMTANGAESPLSGRVEVTLSEK
jgi:hypothetical protein